MSIIESKLALKELLKNMYYKDILLIEWICGKELVFNCEKNTISYFVTQEYLRTGIDFDDGFIENAITSIMLGVRAECKKIINQFNFCSIHNSIKTNSLTRLNLLYKAIDGFYGDECQKFYNVGADVGPVVRYFMKFFDNKTLKGAEAYLFAHGTREEYHDIFVKLFSKSLPSSVEENSSAKKLSSHEKKTSEKITEPLVSTHDISHLAHGERVYNEESYEILKNLYYKTIFLIIAISPTTSLYLKSNISQFIISQEAIKPSGEYDVEFICYAVNRMLKEVSNSGCLNLKDALKHYNRCLIVTNSIRVVSQDTTLIFFVFSCPGYSIESVLGILSMQFCQDHWIKLKKAIDDRGLTSLSAKTSEETIQNITDQLEGTPTNYDPLMDCHWMITNRALERGGLYLLSAKEDGTQYCPICEALQNGGTEKGWIDGPADAALKFAREEGIIPKPS